MLSVVARTWLKIFPLGLAEVKYNWKNKGRKEVQAWEIQTLGFNTAELGS